MPTQKTDVGTQKMITAIDWKNQIEDIAGPYDGNRKSWLSRAARRASVSYRQIAGLYYDQVKDPKFSVASSVLSAAEQARIEATRKEAAVLASRFAVTAEGLNAKDPDFFSAEINSLEYAAHLLRTMART
jgi:hypothetical protein